MNPTYCKIGVPQSDTHDNLQPEENTYEHSKHFGDNWRVHRERLADELEKLSKILTTASKAYEDIDHQLAEALRGTDSKKPGTGGGPK